MTKRNFFTPPQAAKLLEISERTCYRWLAAGKLAAQAMPGDGPHGTRYRIKRDTLQRLGVIFDDQTDNGKGAE